MQVSFINAKSLAEATETQLLVQRQRRVVVGGSVDQNSLDAPTRQPLQRIEDERTTETCALVRRSDGQSLQKTLLGVASAQCVRAHGFAGSAGTEARCCRADLADRAWLQAPRLCERGDIDLARRSVLACDQPLGRAAQRSLVQWWMTWIGVFEQHQFLDGAEPGGLRPNTCGERESCGAHGAVAKLCQPFGPVPQVGKRGKPLLVVEHQLGCLGLE